MTFSFSGSGGISVFVCASSVFYSDSLAVCCCVVADSIFWEADYSGVSVGFCLFVISPSIALLFMSFKFCLRASSLPPRPPMLDLALFKISPGLFTDVLALL